MPRSIGSSMKRLGLAVAAALAAAGVASIVFDDAGHEGARQRPPPTAASGSPAVAERASAHPSDALDEAPGFATIADDSDAAADAPGSDAAPTAAMVDEASQADEPVLSPPRPRDDPAVAVAPPDPPATPPKPGPRMDDAASDAEQARRLNREGIALIDAGRPRQAIGPLERAAGLAPRDAEILDNLGYAYMLTGEHLVASRHFMRALDLAPTRSATWINLGHASAELGQRERAVHAVVTGYRYSTQKATVRAALVAAASGPQYSPQWREVAGLALATIGDG